MARAGCLRRLRADGHDVAPMRTKGLLKKSLLAMAVLVWVWLGAVLVWERAGGNRPLAETFTEIYREKTWDTSRAGTGTSGSGSTLQTSREYRAFLEGFIAEHGVRSVVDAGCGDWEFSQAVDWKGATYLGIDISPEVVDGVKQRFEKDGVRFQVGDVTEDIPAGDLLVCKDVLQHLSNDLVRKFIKNNLRRGKYQWAIITNDRQWPGFFNNRDISSGRRRGLDLRAPPFELTGLVDVPVKFGGEPAKVVQVLDLRGAGP